MSNRDMTRYNKVQSVGRALTILEILPDCPEEGLGVTEIAERLSLPRSTVHRILSTLVGRGFVLHDGEKGRYRIGYKTLEISRKILNNMRVTELIKPYLEKLVEMTGETAGFAVVDKDEARITLSNEVISKNPVRSRSHLGETIPLRDTACGRIYLSMLSHKCLEKLLDRIGRNMVFSGGYDSFNKFKEELAHIRRQGYASSSQPDSESLMAVAAPVIDEKGELVGILEVYGPAYRMARDVLERYGQMVRDAASEISRQTGFVGR
jgi:DNA-binding IclR family transcriptional regulator